VVENIDRNGIAGTMGIVGDDWSKHKLPSDRRFDEILQSTIGWLSNEEYIRTSGPTRLQGVLKTKGLIATKTVPAGLKEPLGVELEKVVQKGSASSLDLGRIGDLVGGFAKSLGSG
jgi:hypothetical protein